MPNNLSVVKEIQKIIDSITKGLSKTDAELVKISKNARDIHNDFQNIKFPKQVNERVKEATEQGEKLNAQMKEQERLNTALIRQLAKKEAALSTENKALALARFETQRLNRDVKEAAILSSTLSTEYEKQQVIIKQLTRRQQDLLTKQALGNKLTREERRELDRVTKELKRKSNALAGVNRQVNRARGRTRNYANTLRATALAARSLASALGLVGGAFLFVRALGDALTVTRDFGKQQATLSGILQVEQEEMTELADDALRLGQTTVKTAGQVTQLQIAYARLGFNQQEIIDLTEATINGSIALNAELADTANLVGAMVNTFDDLKTTDAPEIIDILALATARSALNFSKLETGLPIVAGAANAAGVPFTKLVALMGKLADSGIDVSTSSTALRNIFIIAEAQGLSYAEILELIKDNQNKLTAANDEFGRRAAVSAAVLASNIDATNELDEALQNAAGTAEQMATKELNTLDGAIKLLRSAWEGYILDLNESNDASGSLQNTIKSLARNFKPIVNTLITLAKLWLAYKTAVLLAAVQQKIMNTALFTSATASKSAIGGVSRLTLTWKAFNTALKANILGIVVASLIGLNSLLKRLNVSISESARKLNDTSRAFIEASNNSKALNGDLTEAARRYDELTNKAELNKDEQAELDAVIKLLAKNVPTAVEEIDKYGDALTINTGKVNEFVKANREIAELQAEVNIDNLSKSLSKLNKEQERLQGATEGTNLAFVKGIGFVKQVDGVLKEFTRTQTRNGFIIREGNALTKEQQILFKQTVLDNEQLISQTEEQIQQNQKLLGIDIESVLAGVTQETKRQNEQKKENLNLSEQEIRNVEFLENKIKDLRAEQKKLTAADGARAEQIQKTITALQKEIDQILKNKKARDEASLAIEGSIGFYEKIIEELEKEQKNLATSSEQYQDYERKIKAAQDAIAALKGELSDLNSELDEQIENLNALPVGISIAGFAQFVRDEEERLAQERIEIAEKTAERRKELEREVADEIINFTNAVFANRINRIDREIQANRDKFAQLLDDERLSEEQRSQLEAERDAREAELNEKRRKEQRRAALFNKAISLANVGINTAEEITKTGAQLGFVAAAPLIPLIIAKGALQAATILATPIPEFRKGKGDYDKYEGWATWGEERQEAKIGEDGSVELSPKRAGNHLTYVKSGDVIHPDAKKLFGLKTPEDVMREVNKFSLKNNNAANNVLAFMSAAKMTSENNDRNTNRLIKEMRRNKPKIIINNTTNLGKDARYLARLKDIL